MGLWVINKGMNGVDLKGMMFEGNDYLKIVRGIW